MDDDVVDAENASEEPASSRMDNVERAGHGGSQHDGSQQDGRLQPGQTETEAEAETEEAEAQRDGVTVVGVGGSAGALKPFQELLAGLPAESGMAFVFVLHLPAEGDDHLTDILARHTPMPVRSVEHGLAIAANHVYVARPSCDTEVVDGRFALRETVHIDGVRASIDVLLRSLARARERMAIGLVCSGTGSDGTQGLREIRAAGGLTIVQSPETCEHATMPASAIRADVVDLVLSIDEIPASLLGFTRHPYVNAAERRSPRDAEADLRTLVRVLRTRVGSDFSGYKSGTLLRRAERRMGLHDIDDFDEYVRRLRSDKEEVHSLCRDLRIGVTNFFRDPDAYEALRTLVLPALLESAAERGTVRIWVAACATGEEAYSLVILVREALRNVEDPIDVKVFASDVDDRAIEIARAARYPKTIAADVPEPLLKRYFNERDEEYVVKKPVREAVVFATQDVLVDPPFSRLDLVSCRNLMIYLQPEMQARLLGLLHFGLRDGGYLWLGTAETVGQQSELFEAVSREQRIYRRIGPREHVRVEFPVDTWEPPAPSPLRETPVIPDGLAGWARRMIEDRFVPACVVVDHELQIRYFSGETHDFLVQPMGKPTRDLREMAREGLSGPLRAAIRSAIDTGTATNGTARIRRGRNFVPVSLGVLPLHAPRETDGLFLVTFRDEHDFDAGNVDDVEALSPEDRQSRELEFEVDSIRQELQSALEQLESSTEEYKAAHEEVRSMNEELQSVNEELKTSKEELQSLNEELSSVNQQLQSKVDQLEDVNDDLSNLLRSTDVATLFLDRNTCIQRFTPAMRRVFQLLPGDLGRPISDLAPRFADDALIADVESVLDDLVPIEREVGETGDDWYLRRILPYRTEDDRIEGVVITFTRITEQKLGEQRLRELNETLEQRVAERNWCLELLQRATVIANEATSVEQAVRRTLASVGTQLGWPIGHAYLRRGAVFVDSGFWWLEGAGEPPEALFEASRRLTFRTGDGFVGRVVDTRRPQLWSSLEVARELRFRRVEALEADGLGYVFAFPILIGGEVEGVLEFFGREPVQHRELLGELQQLGVQLGVVVERERVRDALRAAVNETIHVEEQERRDLADALHDDLGQLLAVVRMRLEGLHGFVDDATRGRLEDVEAYVGQAADATRSLTFQLSPPILYELGLTAALEWLADEMERRYELTVRVEGPKDANTIPDRTRFLLFRSARELLVNVAKHAESRAARVVVELDEVVRLVIEDDGVGFDAEEVLYNADGGYGLFSIRTRVEHLGGTMQIVSVPGEGTRIEIALPLPPPSERDVHLDDGDEP